MPICAVGLSRLFPYPKQGRLLKPGKHFGEPRAGIEIVDLGGLFNGRDAFKLSDRICSWEFAENIHGQIRRLPVCLSQEIAGTTSGKRNLHD